MTNILVVYFIKNGLKVHQITRFLKTRMSQAFVKGNGNDWIHLVIIKYQMGHVCVLSNALQLVLILLVRCNFFFQGLNKFRSYERKNTGNVHTWFTHIRRIYQNRPNSLLSVCLEVQSYRSVYFIINMDSERARIDGSLVIYRLLNLG